MKSGRFWKGSLIAHSIAPTPALDDAIRNQHPEWVQPDGSCRQCAVYEYELVEEMAGRRHASD